MFHCYVLENVDIVEIWLLGYFIIELFVKQTNTVFSSVKRDLTVQKPTLSGLF